MTPDSGCVTVCFVALSRTTVSWLTDEPPSDEPAWNGRRFRQQRQRAAVSTVDVLLFYYLHGAVRAGEQQRDGANVTTSGRKPGLTNGEVVERRTRALHGGSCSSLEHANDDTVLGQSHRMS
ncbi:hypothetical protein MRX96_042582 [Rhipicephalus microplus]